MEPQTTSLNWMFGETTIFYVMIWNHPIETTISKWMFQVAGYTIYTNLYLVILEYLSQQIAKIKLMKNTRCYYLEDTVAGPLCKEIRIDLFMVDFPASHVSCHGVHCYSGLPSLVISSFWCRKIPNPKCTAFWPQTNRR